MGWGKGREEREREGRQGRERIAMDPTKFGRKLMTIIMCNQKLLDS